MKKFIPVAALVLFITSGFCFADPCPEELVSAFQKKSLHGIWVHDTSSQESWQPIDASKPLTSASINAFAFIGRKTRKTDDHEGAVAVKFLSLPQGQAAAPKSVLLRRTTPESSCGYRSYLLWFLSHMDFLVGVNVGVDDYIAFHATDSDSNGNIRRFHADYIDENGYCTNSSSGYKRSAFLIDHHEPPVRGSTALISAITQFLGAKSATAEDLPKSKVAKVPSVIKVQLTKFSQYSGVESQLHTYALNGGAVCVRFSDRDRVSAPGSSVIEIVDLDAARGSDFRRRTVRINWQ